MANESEMAMFWDDYNDEQSVDGDDRQLISENLQRIKDSIYGSVDGQPTLPGSGQETSGRDRGD